MNASKKAFRASDSRGWQPGSRRGRAHDAEGARDAILDAGEEVFAEHGFDGARIDAIAAASGYNKSLIFQYFGDKLGLYAAVIRRADEQTRGWQVEAFGVLGALGADVSLEELRNVLRTSVGKYFDYVRDHPRVLRIFNWEMAEGWQTFSRIVTERDYEDVDQFGPVFRRLQRAGLVRATPNALMQYTAALFSCHAYLGLIPLYGTLMPGEDLGSSAALSQAREFLVDFVAYGLLIKPDRMDPSAGKRAGPPQVRRPASGTTRKNS